MFVEVLLPRVSEETKFPVTSSAQATRIVREVIQLAEERDEDYVLLRVRGLPSAASCRKPVK